MFRDQLTKELSNNNEKPVKVIVETRYRQYKNEYGEVVSEGWEIVKELLVRSSNLEKLYKKYPEAKTIGNWR